MKSIKTNRSKYAPWLFLLLAGVLYCCTDDREGYTVAPGDKGTELTFSVNLPANAKTYALDEGDENNVSVIHVLAFKYADTKYTLSDWSEASGSAIQNNGSNESYYKSKKFTLTFTRLKQGEAYKFVLLANAKDEVKSLFYAGYTVGAEKNTILARLQLSGISRWNIDPADSGGYRDIPMWGETSSQDGTGDVTVNPDMTITGLTLLRMVARINVVVSEGGSPSAADEFKLQSVSLYNAYQAGHVVPNMVNLASNSMSEVTLPTIVTGSLRAKGPVVYDDATPGGNISATALTNNIYTFESLVPRSEQGAVHTDEVTCLVIGGAYNGGGTTYYRVNLTQKDAQGNVTYLNILRNHSYTINITKVKGNGYTEKEDAFNAKAANMEAEVYKWNDADITEVAYEGQYMLGVSKGQFSFTREARNKESDDNTLLVTTTWSNGWKVDKIVEVVNEVENDISLVTKPIAGWLKLIDATGNDISVGGANVTTTTKLFLAENTTAGTRTGYIHLSAGRLTYVVKVEQSTVPDLGLSIIDPTTGNEISELLFHNGTLGTQAFQVKWAPTSAVVTVSSTAINGEGFKFDDTSTDKPGTDLTSITDVSGSKLLTITPLAIVPDVFLERISKVNFTTTNGISYMSKSIYLRQVNYALIASGHDDIFLMDGKQHSFTIKSNDAWTAAIANDSRGVLVSLDVTSGSGNVSTGETVKFTLVNDINGSSAGSIGSGTFEITFTSVHGISKTYTINCVSGTVWAGSNIYWNGTTLTFDDYSSAGSSPNETHQGVYFKWGSLWGISPSEPWADSTTVVYKPNAINTGYTESTATSWAAIYAWDSGSITANRDQKYLTETVHTVPGNIAKGFGDICKYLTEQQADGKLHGKKWRLPTSNEFNSVAEPSLTSLTSSNNTDYKWSWTGTAASANATGTATFPNGVRKSLAVGTPFFPAAGCRGYSDGTLGGVGAAGYYWSASPNGTNGYFLYFDYSDVYLTHSASRSTGFSVRCVVE